MTKFLLSTAAYLAANTIGLLLAMILLEGFTIDLWSFVVAVLIFSGVEAAVGPLLTKLSKRHVPQLMGGTALVAILIGLLVTNLLMPGMQIGGIANYLAATLLVWVGSLVAQILLPIYVFKELREEEPSGH